MMNREFLEYYEQELSLLYEQSRDFGTEFPGISDRLGGLNRDAMDPGIVRLLEGAAFLAARVQLKLKSEFSEFTSSLLEQLLPNYQAPIPSSVLVQATPPYENPSLSKGLMFKAGNALDATYVERERRVSCRFQLRSNLELWPLWLDSAEYFLGAAPLQGLGLEVLPSTQAGLRLSLVHRNWASSAPRPTKPGGPLVSAINIAELPVHLVGSATDASALYEQLFAHCHRITLRYENAAGDPEFVACSIDQLHQLGVDESDGLQPDDDRNFAGFEFLRDYFVFPQRYMGFILKRLQSVFPKVSANSVDVILEFDTAVPRLASVVNAAMFALYTAPATNLFEKTCARIPVVPDEHEHHVVADRSHGLDYEVHRIIEVYAHYQGRKDKVPVYPLYSLHPHGVRKEDVLYYATRQLPRRPNDHERRFGMQATYPGTETFLTLYEPAGLDSGDRVRELSVKAMVSNRHIAGQLPVGQTGADFRLNADNSVQLACIEGPTPPRDGLITMERQQREMSLPGPTMWKLINFLSLSHLGLSGRDSRDQADALRELLALFADISDAFTERQLRGIETVSTRQIVRRLKLPVGFVAARGMEITVTFDEKAFEGVGVMMLGVALDRFFAEYTTINSFTETVIASTQRGLIKRWPARSGLGGLL